MRKWCALMTVVLCALWAIPALAQYSDDNEAYNASADGIDLNGQGGFYLPPAGGVSAKVYTYQGNVIGIPAHPTGGGANFVGGRGPGPQFIRSQKDITFGDGTGVWEIAVDVCHNFEGPLPRAQNIGSYSNQLFPGAKGTFILLSTYTDPNTALTWDADMVWFNAGNAQLQEKPGNAAFQQLEFNHWYRRSITVDLDTNLILKVGIEDLNTGVKSTFEPVDRYGWGGSNGGPVPNGFRYFAGTSIAGNTMVFDNLSIEAVSTNTCQYTLSKVKAKRCDACPSKGDNYDTEEACAEPGDCAKKLKGSIVCPNNPDGKCKLKAKGARCE